MFRDMQQETNTYYCTAMELKMAATTPAQVAGVNALIDSGRHGITDINTARDRIVVRITVFPKCRADHKLLGYLLLSLTLLNDD